MRDPGDFDISDCVLGPFPELFDAVAGVSREITSAAQTVADMGGGQLVAHSHSIVNVGHGDGVRYLASVIMCFDMEYIDTTGTFEGNVLNLGPFDTVLATNSAVSGQVAVGSYLMHERFGLAFVGMSHSVTSQTDAHGVPQFFVTAAMTDRKADLMPGPVAEPTSQPAAHHASPPRPRTRFRWGFNKARRTARYRPS